MKYLWALGLFLILLGCDGDPENRNPFLQEVRFRFELDLNLPLYNNLNTIGNPVYVGNAGVGIRGAFVMRNSLDSFIAFEASCPNQSPSPCSTMELDGQNVVCPCDDFIYSLFTGQLLNRPDDGNQYFDLLFYRTSQSGNTVIISN
ncbi:MAG: hypothetical protein AAGC43_15295 [Bacteroidota bacterium]